MIRSAAILALALATPLFADDVYVIEHRDGNPVSRFFSRVADSIDLSLPERYGDASSSPEHTIPKPSRREDFRICDPGSPYHGIEIEGYADFVYINADCDGQEYWTYIGIKGREFLDWLRPYGKFEDRSLRDQIAYVMGTDQEIYAATFTGEVTQSDVIGPPSAEDVANPGRAFTDEDIEAFLRRKARQVESEQPVAKRGAGHFVRNADRYITGGLSAAAGGTLTAALMEPSEDNSINGNDNQVGNSGSDTTTGSSNKDRTETHGR